MADLRIEPTPVPGLLVVHLPLHNDNRGWFKENWQRENMTELGLPDFAPVQNNVSYNVLRGTTRGIHAEPWDKFVSLASGRVFAAWVDLRAGESFGRVFTIEMGPETAIFVPRGVGNSYQTLVENTAYSYLVNDHWSPKARDSYIFVNLGDPALGIKWPVDLADAKLSEADQQHPGLAQVQPFVAKRTLVLGAGGQLGSALGVEFPDAEMLTRSEFDLTVPASFEGLRWGEVDTVINAAAYTSVDDAETTSGRAAAWAANATGVARLVGIARRHQITLVHYSTDYVFDGTSEFHDEDEPMSPLGVYGQSKAAGDVAVSGLDHHYLIRTTWVVGAGGNFVRKMARLADRGACPQVVEDQHGRLTFTADLARATAHLLRIDAPHGTYNVTSSGPVQTWADIAGSVFEQRGRSASDVLRVSTEQYADGRQLAPRPRISTLSLGRIEGTGFKPSDGSEALSSYLEQL